MTPAADVDCLACSGRSTLRPLIAIPDVPIFCNRVYTSQIGAKSAERGDMRLCYCVACGHILNADFNPARVEYDGSYESALTFSPRYRQYAQATADGIIGRYGLRGKRIVEIGCGAGDFLRLLCAAGNEGHGFDPSQPTGCHTAGRGGFEIIGRHFAIEDVGGADFVCCRQVLEHLSEPTRLLRRLRNGMDVSGAVFFEVPSALFILDRLSIWDIIYEHVSYFTPSSLARAFCDAGFTISSAGSDFDDQYLWVEAYAGKKTTPYISPERPADGLYATFGARFAERIGRWRRRIDQLQSDGRRVVVWGAGSKGVMFLNLLGVSVGGGIDRVVDINPRKQGHFVPLTGQPIVGPDHLLDDPPDLVIVMNPEYRSEVGAMLDEIGIRCDVVTS